MCDAGLLSMKKYFIVLSWLVMMLLSPPQFAGTNSQPSRFELDGYQKILDMYEGSAFLMVLWSVDCPPCIDELSMLGQLHQKHPGVNLVMVSTDTSIHAGEINQLMQLNGLGDVRQWVFDGDSVQAIRHAIDPSWYGELPRSYFHQGNHRRLAISGRLEEGVLSSWFKTNDHRANNL